MRNKNSTKIALKALAIAALSMISVFMPRIAAADTIAKIGDTEYATLAEAFAAATAAPADAPKPTIKGIRVADGYVYVTVANTAPYLQYNLAAGTDPANLGEAKAAETPVNGKAGEDIILVAPAKSEGGFFRVGRN